jgi:hypothetical protein
MARAVISAPQRRAAGEPLYDTDPRTGAALEVFYADRVLARSFGTRPGWFWWTCRPGSLPDVPPRGPFASSYLSNFGMPSTAPARIAHSKTKLFALTLSNGTTSSLEKNHERQTIESRYSHGCCHGRPRMAR